MRSGALRVRMSRSRGIVIAGVIVVVILGVQMVTSIGAAVVADRGTADAARDTYSYIGDLMSVRVATMADAASDVVRGTVSEIERAGSLPTDDALVAALADRLDREPAVGSIFVGRPDGSVMVLASAADGYTRLDVAPSPDGATVTEMRYDTSLHQTSGEVRTAAYALADRPWYRLAVDSPGTSWTEPYISARTGDIAVSPVRAVRLDGEIVAVVGADLDVDALATLLDDIPIGDDARAFILTGDGRIIAAPAGERSALRAVVDDTGDIPTAETVGLPATAPTPDDGSRDAFRTQGDTVSLSRSLDPSTGLDWVLHLEARAADLTPGLDRFKTAVLWVTALSIVMVIVAVIFALRVWRPVRVMRHRASTDALTGLSNRYEFSRRSREILRASEDADGTVMLIALDLDDFKGMNDAFGHHAGDAVLAAVGHAMLRSVRVRDVAARLGGDEFVAVLHVGERGAPVEVARRLRDDVERAIRGATDGAGRVGVTAGFATTDECGHDLRTLQHVADDALVAGKRREKGRTYGPRRGTDDPGREAEAVAAGSLPGD